MRVGSDAAPARVLFTQSTHPGGAGAPPGGQYGPPARSWLTDGRFPEMERPAKSAARCRKENAVMARREAPVLSRGSTATKNNGCATWRAIPLVCRGVREKRRRRAYPGPRQTIRVMTLGLMMGCLKSESQKRGMGLQ